MSTFNYKFIFGKQKYQIKIEASCAAEAQIKFKDYVLENISVVSKTQSKPSHSLFSIGKIEPLSLVG